MKLTTVTLELNSVLANVLQYSRLGSYISSCFTLKYLLPLGSTPTPARYIQFP